MFQDLAAIKGTITDAQSSITNAQVCAWSQDRKAQPVCVFTDKNGTYNLQIVGGKYVIRASKESDGYPKPLFTFFDAPNAWRRIDIKNGEKLDVSLQLGPKHAPLRYSMHDESGNLKNGGFDFEVFNFPQRMLNTSAPSSGTLLIPVNTRIRFKAVSDTNESWTSDWFSVKPGESVNAVITFGRQKSSGKLVIEPAEKSKSR